MKRFISIFLLILVFIGFAEAAYIRSFRQRGPATHEIKSSDLVGAHPSLPMGTKVTITNLQNGYTTVVAINGRIAASGSRIIDLSEGAAKALGMAASGATQITLEVIRERSETTAGSSGAVQDEEYFEE
jgi:rare lipoprotein A